MPLYRIDADLPRLRAPAIVLAFDSWVDAGGAATGAAGHIGAPGRRIGEIDCDTLIDYRSRRPILDVVDGEVKNLAWHEIPITLVESESRDVLVVAGPEPDFRWRSLAASMVDLATQLGVIELVVLGAIPAAVPHTRAVPLTATATPRERLGVDEARPPGLLRVPAAAVSAIQAAFIERQIPVVGFFAQVPHYVSPVYTAGVLALIERTARHLRVNIPLGSLVEQAREQRGQLDAILTARPEVAEHVARLESMTPEESGIAASERIPSGDEIAAEVEKFLRGDAPDR